MVSKEENILLNAEKLFAEKGFDATSTREISAAANVNVSMISYYFGSKERLFEKIFEYRMKQSTDYAKEILENNVINEWQKLLSVINSYISRIEKLKDFYNILQTEQITNKNPQIAEFMKVSKIGFIEIYSKVISDGCKKGIFTKKPLPEFIHATVIGTVFYAFNSVDVYKEFRKDKQSEEKFRTQFFEELKQHLTTLLKDLLGYEEQ